MNDEELDMIKKKTTAGPSKIECAADDALKTIALAASEATRVVASAAVEAAKVVNLASSADHDLLIELKTRMESLREDIKSLKNDIISDIDDHETRIFALENSRTKQTTLISIATGILSILVGLMVFHLFGA